MSAHDSNQLRRLSDFGNIVVSGPRALRKWHQDHPGELLDCSGLDIASSQSNFNDRDLSNVDFSDCKFEGVTLHSTNFRNCRLAGASFRECNLALADFSGADLTNTNFEAAELSQAKFGGATFSRTRFDGANLQDAKLGARGLDLSSRSFSNARLTRCNLEGFKLSGSQMLRASLQGAHCAGASFNGADLTEATFQRGDFTAASFRGAQLKGATLAEGNFTNADFQFANFLEAHVDHANFQEVRGLPDSIKTETVVGSVGPRYLDTATVSVIDRWFSWEMLRIVGRLPLFGASYSALILMPLLFYFLQIYNQQIERVRSSAVAISQSEGALASAARAVIPHIHAQPVPQQSFVLFICTIVLAAAATIYAVRCPPRIKEFSKEQWQDQLGKSLIHYQPFSWKHRYERMICAGLYAVGGLGVAYVLLRKIWNTIVFLAHSNFSG